MKQLRTVRVRFALWTAGWLLAVLVLLDALVYFSFARGLGQAVDNALRLTAAQLVLDFEADEDSGQVSLVNLVEDIPDVVLQEQFSMRILDLAGQPVEVYGPYQDLPQPHRAFISSDQPGTFTSFDDPTTRHPVRVYTVALVRDNQVIGTLQVAQNLLNVQQVLSQLWSILLISGPVIVIIAGVGGYVLAARALAPIDQITRTARRISGEDLSARLNLPPTDDEVGRLAATLDTMLGRLENAFQRERQFTADASHELRTPLTTIQTILSTTLARRRTPTEYDQALSDLVEETDRMKQLTEELLFLARNDLSQPAPYESMDLSTLLQDVTDSLQPLAEDKGLKLSCEVPEKVTLTGDSDGLVRLFVNLLENAIKFTEEGHITVGLDLRGDKFIEVTVADTGIGIAPEHLRYIFERFYRVDQSRATLGTGLGLAIALNVAEAHGGTIKVESEVGLGTVLTVQMARGS
jgi:heavy metal sensor kinase